MAYKDIETSFIYGSFAKDAEKKVSDIDLIVVGKFNRDRFIGELRLLKSKLNREINFTSYATKDEFNNERKKAGSFLDVVLKSKIVLLKGNIDG